MTSKQVLVSCNLDYKEILIAEFASIGYDSFQETEAGFITYTDSDIDISALDTIVEKYTDVADIAYEIELVEKENWNKKWEESYDPIIIDGKCMVRASFHEPRQDLPIEIIINPKMSFGTGHHETTRLMMEAQLELDHSDRAILDAGSGTGILSILAGKLGAKKITAFDNDTWVIDNIQENFKINDVKGNIRTGTVQSLSFVDKFDIILANINKNILLQDIPDYAKLLTKNGSLLMSGFYQKDKPEIEEKAANNGLKLTNSSFKNDWAMTHYLAK